MQLGKHPKTGHNLQRVTITEKYLKVKDYPLVTRTKWTKTKPQRLLARESSKWRGAVSATVVLTAFLTWLDFSHL